MALYKCEKCEATGHSKCISQRSFFPDDQNEATLSWVLKYEVKTEEAKLLNDEVTLQHTVTLYHYWMNDTVNKEEALLHAFRTIKNLSEETLRHYVCTHRYRLQSDHCDLGCCGTKLKGGLDGEEDNG